MEKSNKFDSTILIVDDRSENIDIVSEIFKDRYIVKAAKSGEQAIKLIHAGKPPDLILLDIIMPGIDGYEVARQLKQDYRTKNIPIIFLTAQKKTASLAQGFRLGAQDYVVKPFNVTELRARVETHLELKKNREALANINRNLERLVQERTQELEQANRQLIGLSKAKSRFLSLISHEMNTPVAVLLGYTEVLEEDLKHSEYGAYIKEIKDAIERLQRFAEKALLITKLQAKEYEMNKKRPIPVQELINNAIEANHKFINDKQISMDIDTNPSVHINVDAKLIQSVLNGILDNAIRFSPESGSVYILTELLETEILVRIRDNGPGFSEDALHSAFDLFALGEDPVKLNFGLHLTTSKLIMEAHGGGIHIDNSPSGGAMVTLIFRNG